MSTATAPDATTANAKGYVHPDVLVSTEWVAQHLNDPKVRILAISGGGRVDANEYLSVARKFGAVEVLSKPFTRDELRKAVDAALGTGEHPKNEG